MSGRDVPSVVDEPATASATVEPPKLPFLLRRSGETRVLQSPLTVEEVAERVALYRGEGKRRAELARVQGRTIVARTKGGQLQISSYRRYLLGVMTTALCVPHATPNGTLVLTTFSTVRYRRIYTVTALLAIIIAIFAFAPADPFWMRTLLAFGVLLIVSNWRFSRETKETRAEKRWLVEFVRNLLDASEVPRPAKQREATIATQTEGQAG